MITPRSVTLHRVPDLASLRTTLTRWVDALPPIEARDVAVIVPTRAAAEQLRRTIERVVLHQDRAAIVWPLFLTRRDLYDELASRLPSCPRVLSPVEREVLLASGSRRVLRNGVTLPYDLRPALVAEMLALYDQIRRLGRSIDDFERNFRDELEKEQDTDHGAARLLEQTIFLTAAYRAYEDGLQRADRRDEHGVRDLLLQDAAAQPLVRAIVTVADRIADPDGLWPADFDLLARLPNLETIDLLCTEAVLGAGALERLYGAFPDIAEERPLSPPRALPVLVIPGRDASDAGDRLAFSYRDREEELIAVARRLKQQRREGAAAPLHRTALIVRRPLPYLYLARDVFADAGIAFESLDTLPLAAEPYAAAVDLVLDVVSSDFSRSALLALLRSPHFRFEGQDEPGWDAAVSACDLALAEARYLGGFARLQSLAAAWTTEGAAASREQRRRQTALPALRALLDTIERLRPLAEPGRTIDQAALLIEWLKRFDRPTPATGESRRRRVRAAVIGALVALRDAHAEHDPEAEGDVVSLTAALRRWLGGQTVAVQSGEPGLQIVDAAAARYGDFDDVQVVGLVDGEWPERVRRNVLYPSSLLALLEPTPAVGTPMDGERDAMRGARAAFRDLLLSAAAQVSLSTFVLENDAVVESSLLLDDVPALGLQAVQRDVSPARVMQSEALALEPRRAEVLPAPMLAWGALRVADDSRPRERLRGDAGPWQLPRVSVSRLELFLNCPFKFFASHVLKLEEEPEDQDLQTPLERGRFLHDLWEQFFAEWQRRGHGRISHEQLPEARTLFTEVCDAALAGLSPVEAALERNKLIGSAISAGIAHRVLAMEASRPTRIIERLLEFPLQGEFEVRGRDGSSRRVALNAKTDRIDVLEGSRLRVIDYKSKTTPDPKVALQLPIYAHLARELLKSARGGEWSLDEAMYVSFEGDKCVVPLKPAKGETLEQVIDDAEDRLLNALDRIGEGRFPPQPAKKSLCGMCSYSAVCRMEIRQAEQPEDLS